MKGLLIKDFRLMKVQKNFFALIMVIGLEWPCFQIIHPILLDLYPLYSPCFR